MAFKARKPKQQFRKKSASFGGGEEDETNTSVSEAPVEIHTADQPPSVPSTPSSSLPPPTTPTNGTKDKEEQEKSTPSSSSSKAKPAVALLSFEEEAEEEEFTEKKSRRSKRMTKQIKESKVRPLQRALPEITSTASAAHAAGSVGEYTPERLAELRRNASSSRPRPADPSLASDPFAGAEPEIPTPEQVHAARERRAKMREEGGGTNNNSTAKDFIPLHGDSGRLVREEGEDDDVDEEGRATGARIEMNAMKIERERERKEAVINLNEVEDDDDEELKRWEMDRIRKGVGAHSEIKRKDLLEKASNNKNGTAKGINNKSPGRIGLDLNRDKPTITIDTITKDINLTLSGLQSAHRSHSAQLERVTEELNNSNQQLESLLEEMKNGTNEYSFFAGMKVYVADLLDCLGAKAELVEHAEDKLISANRVRFAKNRSYYQKKIENAGNEAKSISDEAAGYSTSTGAARVERKEKKKERKRGEEEGWSSDSESEEVNNEFILSQSSAREEGKAVFADVSEEYSSLSIIKSKFEIWKNEYPSSYKQAYISLSMPQLFSPFVRLQLLNLDLLPRERQDKLEWYKQLIEYGRGEGGEGLKDAEDEDNFLVPKLIEKVVVPRIIDAITHAWTPQSRSLNLLAIRTVHEALDYAIDPADSHVKELVACVFGGLQQSVTEVNIPIFPKVERKENKEESTIPWEFSCRMFWRGVKLLQNILAWHELIAAKPLQQLAISSLLTQKLVPFLRSIRESRPSLFLDACESILSSFPPSWLKNNNNNNNGNSNNNERKIISSGVVPELGLFHDNLLRVAKQLAGRGREREREEDKWLERALRMLERLNDHETARAIAKANSIKL